VGDGRFYKKQFSVFNRFVRKTIESRSPPEHILMALQFSKKTTSSLNLDSTNLP
jgi:hypothetical protein